MKRDILIAEIVKFCFDYDMRIDENQLKEKIDSKLNEVEFVESLINTIIIKAKNSNNINPKKVKELLIELEIIRLELEFRDYNKVS